MLRLEYPGDDSTLTCGATILNKQYGLTACHRLAKESVGTIFAHAGLYYLNKSDPLFTQTVRLTNWTIHDCNASVTNTNALYARLAKIS